MFVSLTCVLGMAEVFKHTAHYTFLKKADFSVASGYEEQPENYETHRQTHTEHCRAGQPACPWLSQCISPMTRTPGGLTLQPDLSSITSLGIIPDKTINFLIINKK